MSDEKITIDGPGPLAEIGIKPPAIDWTKPVRMIGFDRKIGGYKVHIYAIDHNLTKPVVGRYEGSKDILQWTYEGIFIDMAPLSAHMNLENVP